MSASVSGAGLAKAEDIFIKLGRFLEIFDLDGDVHDTRHVLLLLLVAGGSASRHSMTSSARASTVAGTSSPSALAVLRLITNSNLVGFCTGRSAGFSPLRMRST